VYTEIVDSEVTGRVNSGGYEDSLKEGKGKKWWGEVFFQVVGRGVEPLEEAIGASLL